MRIIKCDKCGCNMNEVLEIRIENKKYDICTACCARIMEGLTDKGVEVLPEPLQPVPYQPLDLTRPVPNWNQPWVPCDLPWYPAKTIPWPRYPSDPIITYTVGDNLSNRSKPVFLSAFTLCKSSETTPVR